MTNKILLTLLCLFLAGCSTKVEIKQCPLNEINHQLSLDWLSTETTPVSGYYTTNSAELPDGPFAIESIPSSSKNKSTAEQLSLNISGEFDNGKKVGQWHYAYQYREKKNLYENYSITFLFENGKCQQGSFRGIIGKNMPIKEYNFTQKPQLCNPMQLREMMMDLP